MIKRFENADHTIVSIYDPENRHAIIVEQNDPRWDVTIADGDVIPYEEGDPIPTPVPQQISRFQARAALMDAGLLADAELAIADADPLTQLAWAEATEWRRDSPSIAAIGAILELESAQIDDLFRAAAQIVA